MRLPTAAKLCFSEFILSEIISVTFDTPPVFR